MIVDHEEASLAQKEKAATSRRFFKESNTRITSEWLERLGGFILDPMSDMKDCLEHIESLERDEKDVAQYILSSTELDEWLQEECSSILEVDIQTPPASLYNPLSFVSAMLSTSIRSTAQFPVLAFFCWHRNNNSHNEEISGPTALVKSLNGQLLQFIAEHRPLVNLSALKKKEFFSEAQTNFNDELLLLTTLIVSLPADDTIFIIIDSLSYLSADGDEVMKKLSRIAKKNDNVVLKVLVTNALPGSYVKKVADLSLYVQDTVPGFGGIDVHGTGRKINKNVKRKRNGKFRCGDTASSPKNEKEDEVEDDESGKDESENSEVDESDTDDDEDQDEDDDDASV